MNKQEYGEYLQSDEWQIKRRIFLNFWNHKCALCPGKATHVHHRDYEKVGDERFWDCIALCDKCHERHHGIIEQGREIQSVFTNLGSLPKHIFEGAP